MRHLQKIRTGCLQNVDSAHELVRPIMSGPATLENGFRPLSRVEIEAEILKIDMAPRAEIVRRADQLAGDYPGEGRDLLQEAVTRALSSRSCREGITGEQFVAGIMRSITSTARRGRERRGENPASIPVEVLVEQMGVGPYTVQTADEVIETERVRRLCENVLDQLASVSPLQAELIEGIGLNLRGQNLADYLGITRADLATVRRALKRNAQRVWAEAESQIFKLQKN